MPLIAMNREMGSLGKDVAQGLAEALGVRIRHHEVIEHLADKMRLRRSHVVSYLQGRVSLLDRLTTDQTSLHVHTADEIMRIASETPGVVLRGWGATALLRGVPHAIRICICAPLPVRVARMAERLATDDLERMASEVSASDEAYRAIMQRHFGVQANDPSHYDATFNTERMTVEECVGAILRMVKSPVFTETPASRQLLADRTLEAQVRAALRHDTATRAAAIAIEANGGRVVLAGIVKEGVTARACERVAATVPGVIDVQSTLRAMDEARSLGSG